MLRTWLDRLQTLWVQNTRNRIVIMVSTAVVAVLLLCGCLNLLGAAGAGVLNSLFVSGPPVRPTISIGTQVANVNPTFPLATPTVYGYPNPPAQNVPASNTPPPTPTSPPEPSVTVTPPNGQNPVTYTLGPNPNAFTAGTTNQIILSGPPRAFVSVSVYAVPACLSMAGRLDNTGQLTLTCNVPANLKGSMTNVSIQVVNPPAYEQFPDIPIN